MLCIYSRTVLSDCDWKKYEAMPWHIKADLKIKAILSSLGVNLWPFGSDCTFILAIFYQPKVKTAETIALLSTNFTLSLFYTLPVKRLLHMQSLSVDFQTLLQFTSFLPFLIALGFLAWSFAEVWSAFFRLELVLKTQRREGKKASMSEGSSSNHLTNWKHQRWKIHSSESKQRSIFMLTAQSPYRSALRIE